MSEEMIRQISEAIRIRGERPAHVQIQDMINRGAINERGEVLLKGPGIHGDECARTPNATHSAN